MFNNIKFSHTISENRFQFCAQFTLIWDNRRIHVTHIITRQLPNMTIEEKNVDASTIIPKKTKTYGYYAHVVISGNVFKNT